jgi:hypothetical protein
MLTIGLTVVERLKVIDQAQNVVMVLRDSSEHIDLITNHMLTTLHQRFVDDFHGIILPSFNLEAMSMEQVAIVSTRTAVR